MNILLLFALMMLYQQSDGSKAYHEGYKSKEPPKKDALKMNLDEIYGTTNDNNCDGKCGKPLYLTPYIESNQTEKGRKAALVDPRVMSVPGVDIYAGYITVDKVYNSNLFFWYFKLRNCSSDTPIVTFFQGGPGAPSAYGLFLELGPLTINSRNEATELKTNSWIRSNLNLLFIDAPVGTGYSFTNSDAGYSTNSTMEGKNVYNGLLQFSKLFPEQDPAPLYLMSASYGSKTAIAVALEAYADVECEDPLNVQGIIMFNPFIEPAIQLNYSSFGLQTGLLDRPQADQINQLQLNGSKALADGDGLKAFEFYSQATGVFNTYARLPSRLNFAKATLPSFSNAGKYLQQPKIRRALHVGNTTFTAIGKPYEKLKADVITSVKKSLEQILGCYRVLICHGLLTTVSVIAPAVRVYKSLEFDGAAQYKNATRQYLYNNGFLAGYLEEGGNLTVVGLLRAGQMVPIDQPANTLKLVTDFINKKTLLSRA